MTSLQLRYVTLASLLWIFAVLLAGCGKVNAQGPGLVMSGTTAGTTTTIGCAKNYHLDGAKWNGVLCIKDDGKPPQFVDAELTSCDGKLSDSSGWTCRNITPAHWTCEKGYELDGSTVTWPDGIAKISPARCKAKEKP
jgi:hypothetical protein